MITMKGSMAQMLLAVLFAIFLAWSTSIPASAEEWEVKIVASTPDRAENSLYLGQKLDATDGYDGGYEVRAMLSGSIEAYFPRTEWDVIAPHFWRDIKAPGQMKSWDFEVNTALSGAEIMLRWNPVELPEGYAVVLTDMATSEVIDMNARANYYYTDTGLREFTVNASATETPEEPESPAFLVSPSGLDGAWGENNMAIHLVWTDNSEGESGFILERKASGEQWTLLAMLDANTTAYIDYTLPRLASEPMNNREINNREMSNREMNNREMNNREMNNRVLFLYRLKAYNSLTESEFSNSKLIK